MTRQIIYNNQKFDFTACFEDGSNVTELRRQLANRFLRTEYEHGLTPSVADTCYAEMVKVATSDSKRNDEKIADLLRYVYALQTRRAYNTNRHTLIFLSCIYFKVTITHPDGTIEHEPTLDPNGEFDTKKYEAIINSSEDDMLFFCEVALRYTPELRHTQIEDLNHFLAEMDDLLNSSPMP